MNKQQSLCEKRIIEKYPQAKRASDGVNVGDVLVNHPDIPGVVATNEILERFSHPEYYWVVANVGDGYIYKSDLQDN